MQFHLNGFRAGAPDLLEADKRAAQSHRLDEVDVLIVGCGPAGLALAAQLAAFPDVSTRIVDQKEGPLQLGQADGVACRTMEIFEAYDFSERVLKEAYFHNEMTFWKPSPERPQDIVRGGRIADPASTLSEFPHVVLNQARLHDFFLDRMKKSQCRLEPDYGLRFKSFKVADPNKQGLAYPVEVTLEPTETGSGGTEVIRARYLVGCDGARSAVRKSMGRELVGDSDNQAWGVMDVLAVTDFPDMRLKVAIHSAEEGNILIIPREGGYLVRLYIELDKLNENERVSSRNITADQLIGAAQRILHPYSFDVKEVAWWSVYEIGQRLCDRFDNLPGSGRKGEQPRVFIAGDACHTHSPKAGQGMNVSIADAFNLGWKLASVVRGQCTPEVLETYTSERRSLAQELIDFDREFARMFSARPKQSVDDEMDGVDPAEFQKYFVKQSEFTAGTTVHYAPSLITGDGRHQHLAKGFAIGTRFHSAPVIRMADAKLMHIGHVLKADGRWRLMIFASKEDPTREDSRVQQLCRFLLSEDSPVFKYTPSGADVDSIIDTRAIFQQARTELQIQALPDILRPPKGRYGLVDFEKLFSRDDQSNIFEMRGIDRDRGCLVVVRPDQHIANVLPLDAHAELAAFFEQFMLPRLVTRNSNSYH